MFDEGPNLTIKQGYLLAMYKEHCDQSRQHENQRQLSTTIIITLSSAFPTLGLGLVGTSFYLNNYLCGAPRIVVAFVFIFYSLIGIIVYSLGRFGKDLSLKYYERTKKHNELARAYREHLELILSPWIDSKLIRDSARGRHEHKSVNRYQFSERDVHEDGFIASVSKGIGFDEGKKIVERRLYEFWLDLYKFTQKGGLFYFALRILTSTYVYFRDTGICK